MSPADWISIAALAIVAVISIAYSTIDPEEPIMIGVIICPRCGATSHNLNDMVERYCGRCHHYHDDPVVVEWVGGPLDGRTFRMHPATTTLYVHLPDDDAEPELVSEVRAGQIRKPWALPIERTQTGPWRIRYPAGLT